MAANQIIFENIKQQTPSHISLAQTIASLLQIKIDTAYRLLKGERELTISELSILLSHYPIALEKVISLPKNKILLEALDSTTDNNDFYHFLETIHQYLLILASSEKIQLHYLCKDLNFFHFFYYPELAAFKIFFWNKTIKSRPAYAGMKFKWPDDNSLPYLKLGQKILNLYHLIPSIEIFSMEVINSTLYQILYYKKNKLFENHATLLAVTRALKQCIKHIITQATIGTKAFPKSATPGAGFQLYLNEFMIGTNTLLFDTPSKRLCVLNHSLLGVLVTTNDEFTDQQNQHFYAIKELSTPVNENKKKSTAMFNNVIKKLTQIEQE